MWIVLFAFGFATLVLGWLLCGYIVWLRFARDPCDRPEVARPAAWPRLSIVVPCFNEERFIADKLRNLLQCDYPGDRIEIVFADGGSTDGTLDILGRLVADSVHVRVLRCPEAGKINQLNYTLPLLTGDVVVVTDADARLAPDALIWLATEFEADPQVAVVGACTSPRGGLPVERCYWAAQNRIRMLESAVGHVTIVAACGYAFRRGLISRFPEDVVADDVYCVVHANTLGYRTVYSDKATVEELRSPLTLTEFFQHKFRKGNAVLREMLRVDHRLPDMDGRWKFIFMTSLAQQLFLPLLSVLWIVLGAALVNLGEFDLVGLAVGFLFLATLAARKVAVGVDLPPSATGRFNIVTLVVAYCYTMVVLCATALTYTFFRQGSCYRRLGPTAPPAEASQLNREPRLEEPAVKESISVTDFGVPAGVAE